MISKHSIIDELEKEHSGISKQNYTFPSGPSKECSELELPLFLLMSLKSYYICLCVLFRYYCC